MTIFKRTGQIKDTSAQDRAAIEQTDAVLAAARDVLAKAQQIKPKSPLGYIAYEGPSVIDGAPIVVIINKIDAASGNSKTGELVQSFIIRADVGPTDALKIGEDVSICGTCPHRPILAKQTGDAPCYVNVGRSVRSVFDAYKRGRYARADLATIAAALAGKRLRLGTYGDPAAAPAHIWHALAQHTSGHVGYTHQWQAQGFDVASWAPLVRASCDSHAETLQARALGMRSFRVSIGVDKRQGEASCPASKEARQKTTCAKCMLCGGTSKAARDIVIADHAAGAAKRAARIVNIAIAA